MNLLFHHIQGTEWIFGIFRNIFHGIQGFVVNELLVGINLSIDNRITFRLRLGYLLDAHNQECDDSGGRRSWRRRRLSQAWRRKGTAGNEPVPSRYRRCDGRLPPPTPPLIEARGGNRAPSPYLAPPPLRGAGESRDMICVSLPL